MHIGFITPELPGITTYSGGIGTSIANLSKRFITKNIACTVFVIDQNEEKEIFVDGVRVITLKKKTLPFIAFWVARKGYERRINYYTKHLQIDVLEAPDWTGITAFCNFNIPLVIRVHGSDTYFCHLEKRHQKKKNFWFEKNAWQRADHRIAVSAFSARVSKELFGTSDPVKVIANGINTDYFTPDHSDIKPNTILYFGTVIRKKGVLAFAKAYNKIIQSNPLSRWIIIGKDATDALTGTSTKKLVEQTLSKKALASTEFLGLLPYDQVRQHIKQATVIVLPSYAEAFPMTWLEAMAMEKPIVASNIGWATEMMENGVTGWLVKPDHTDELAQKTLLQIENKEDAKKMAQNARNVVREKFHIDRILEKNINFYKSITRS